MFYHSYLDYNFLNAVVQAQQTEETIFVNLCCDSSKVLFSNIAVAISQWEKKDPFYILWETWVEWLMLC